MIEYSFAPKTINPDQLISELGFPCSVETDGLTGLAFRVWVQLQYQTGLPPNVESHTITTDVEYVKQIVDAHVGS